MLERLTRRMDKARADVTGWYRKLVTTAADISNYMSPSFMEKRASEMDIWSCPRAVVFGQDTDYKVLRTYKYNISHWELKGYFSNESIEMIEAIIEDFFVPINTAISKFDNDLSLMEQGLTSSIKSLRDLMSDYTRRDKLDENFVR